MESIRSIDGDKLIEANSLVKAEGFTSLKDQLQNFYQMYEGDALWDTLQGLSYRIIWSRNKEQIKSHIVEKTLSYYGDRVLNVRDIEVEIGKEVSFKGTIDTIYGAMSISGISERR